MVDLTNVKINGKAIEPILKAFMNEQLAKSIIEQGLETTDFDVNKKYPAENYIKSLNIIEERMGAAVLKKVGKLMMESAKWPPNVTDLESGLQSIDAAYRMNHFPNTPAKIGSYVYSKIKEGEYEILCDNPYPCGLDLGIITGVATAFSKKAYVSHKAGTCRNKGENKCIYTIKA